MDIWSEILSRDPDRIRNTFLTLTPDEKVTVRAHLARMIGEPGWHPEQVTSASIAVETIEDLPDA